MEGKNSAAALMKRHEAEPENPEPLILLAGKYQERQNREKALELSKEAISLDPKGIRMMRRENGEIVSCKEMAEYQYARTFVVTFGLIDHSPIEEFIRKYPSSPLLRDAYLDSLAVLMSDESGGEYYKRMAQAFPHDPKLANRLALFFTYSRQGTDYSETREVCLAMNENALSEAESVSLPATAKTVANLYLLKGNPEKAEEVYGDGFLGNRLQAWTDSLLEYAEFWLNQNRNKEDAEEAIDRAVRLAELPGTRRRAASLYLKPLGKTDKALEIYGPEFLKTIQDSQSDLYSYFNLWTRQKANEASALEALERLLQLTPDSVFYRSAAASALWTAGQPDRARAVFGPEFISKAGDNMNTLYEYGMFWLQKNTDVDQAAAALTRSLRTIPKPYYAHRQTAEALMKAGRLESVLEIYGPDYLAQAQSIDELTSYADFWMKEGKNADSAIRALETASQIPNPTAWNRMYLARLFLDAKKPNRAEDVFGPEYLKTIEADAESLYRYAEFWKFANRNLFSSLDAARKACEVDPKNGEAWRILADVCVVTSNPKEGLAAVEKALSLTKTPKEREKLETLKKQIQAALEKK